MKYPGQNLVLLLFFTCLPSSAISMGVYKPSLCGKHVRQIIHQVGDACRTEEATYRVVSVANGAESAILEKLGPTRELESWAKCIGENWSKMEHAVKGNREIGEVVKIKLQAGACDS